MAIVIDSSALIAILQDEPERKRLVRAVHLNPVRRMSAATLVEAGIVMEGRHGDLGRTQLDALLARAAVEIVPLTVAHAGLAREAFRRYGKGRHPARLNLGDCFSYALAQALSEPLLFVGGDFGQTDVAAAAY